MKYQNPTKFKCEITLIEFDLSPKETGNHYLTYAEWNNEWGENQYASGPAMPDHIRLQVALQIAGDLVISHTMSEKSLEVVKK